MVTCPNPKCGSSRVIWQGKKYKCLDCFKTFKFGKSSKQATKEDVTRMMAWIRRSTGIDMVRDLNLDDPKFKESDIIKEE